MKKRPLGRYGSKGSAEKKSELSCADLALVPIIRATVEKLTCGIILLRHEDGIVSINAHLWRDALRKSRQLDQTNSQ